MENGKKPDSYAKAGVDIRKEELTIRGIKGWVTKTFKFREGRVGEVMKDVGSFANVIDMGEFALAMSADGVGSKVLVAQELDKYDTVGIDLVAMNVNDLICLGAEPIAMVDYLAMCRADEDIASEIGKGLFEGARQAEIAVVGGETASLPEVICGVGNKGFDLGGAVIGVVKKDEIITGEKVAVGDTVLGLASSGIHSSGLTLARKVLEKNMWNNLLTPTRIYVKQALTLIKEFDVHGLANITGSGMLNLQRVTPHGFLLDSLPEPDVVFKKISELGKIPPEEMYRTFNMGVGFTVIAPPGEADKMLEKYGREFKMTRIGEVVAQPGVEVKLEGKQIKL